MKAIMISIQPKYVAGILNGKKIMEIRKTTPNCDLPIDVYIYCTKDKKMPLVCDIDGNIVLANEHYAYGDEELNGKVVAKFTLKDTSIIQYHKGQYIFSGVVPLTLEYATMCSYEDIDNYLKGKNGYTWHIRNLEIFDKPKELSEFNALQRAKATDCGYLKQCKNCGKRFNRCHLLKPLTRAPQSYCFIEF